MSGWKVAQSKNHGKTHSKGINRKHSQFTTNISSAIFDEIDRENVQFETMTEAEKEVQVKELWATVRKAITKIIAAPDFISILSPIYKSLIRSTRHITSPVGDVDVLGDILTNFHGHARLPGPLSAPSPLVPTIHTYNIDFSQVIIPTIVNLYDNDKDSTPPTTQEQSNNISELAHPSTFSPPSLHSFSFTHSSFGIGSISKSSSSLFQFAIYLILVSLFPASQQGSNEPQQPLIYDPMFTPLDRLLFSRLGLKVLSNTEGRIPSPWLIFEKTFEQDPEEDTITFDAFKAAPSCSEANNDAATSHPRQTTISKHISFIPHCPIGISHNLIQSLWAHFSDGSTISTAQGGYPSENLDPLNNLSLSAKTHVLNNLILISNSFDQIFTQILVPDCFFRIAQYLPIPASSTSIITKKNKKGPTKLSKDDPLAIPISTLSALYPSVSTDPHFYYALNYYVEYIEKYQELCAEKTFHPAESSEASKETPISTSARPIGEHALPPPLPSLSLLLLKPWTHEEKITFSSHHNLLNDMGVHSFSFSTQRLPDQTDIATRSRNILFSLCRTMPSYTPPVSSNPELIPSSLRSQ